MSAFEETVAEDLLNALTILKLVRDGTLGLDALDDVDRRIRLAVTKSTEQKGIADLSN